MVDACIYSIKEKIHSYFYYFGAYDHTCKGTTLIYEKDFFSF